MIVTHMAIVHTAFFLFYFLIFKKKNASGKTLELLKQDHLDYSS